MEKKFYRHFEGLFDDSDMAEDTVGQTEIALRSYIWRAVSYLDKWVAQLVKKFSTLYRTWKFISISQQPATGPYPEPEESSPHPPTFFP